MCIRNVWSQLKSRSSSASPAMLEQPLLVDEGTPGSSTSTSSWEFVAEASPAIPALLEKLETGFENTRVLEAQPSFFADILRGPGQIIFTHCCLVLGPAGAGKTTLMQKLVGPGSTPIVPPGPRMGNRTMQAQGVLLKLGRNLEEDLVGLGRLKLEDLDVVMIDTPGWSPKASTNIKKEYKRILKKRKLVSHHTPHIIFLCIPVSMLRQFPEEEAKKMSNQLEELKFDRRFPIKVLPIATKADHENPEALEQLMLDIKKLAEDAFQGTEADIEEPTYTMDLNKEGDAGMEFVDRVKEGLVAMLFEQIKSPDFRGLWLKAFARSLAEHAMNHCEMFPANDSAIRLFHAARGIIKDICGREQSESATPILETDENGPALPSQDALQLPWGEIIDIAVPAKFQNVWFCFRAICLTFCAGIGLNLAWTYSLGICFVAMLFLVAKDIWYWSWEKLLPPYSRYLKSTRLQRQGLAVCLLPVVAFSLYSYYVMDQQLGEFADEMANRTLANSALQEKLNAKTKKLDSMMSCGWDDQTEQCLGLSYLDTVSDADACRDVCCKMGQDHCSIWQFKPQSGCWLGKSNSCAGDWGWKGGRRN
eukprot:Skav236359  [mRNA]  locus=scaffold3883:14889:16661:+ [translate_table: standard]